MKDSKLVKIGLYFAKDNPDNAPYKPSVYMTVPVPSDRDEEEYIDEFLDNILNKDIRYNTEWNYE